MPFDTRKEVSEFTQRALDGNVKEISRLTGMSKTDLYAILAGQRADHLGYSRDIHRALCTCDPEAAAEYRELLESDRALLEGSKRNRAASADEDHLFHYCQKLTDTINKAGRGQAERDDVLSEARKLHQKLTTFINAESRVTVMSPREVERALESAG